MILNLDKEFNPKANKEEVAFKAFTFKGGEPHIKISESISNLKELTISHRIQNFNDFGLLLVALDACKNLEVNKINLILPYFPGARQDRLMVPGEALTVKVYANLINQLKVNNISIYDAHSEVTPALLNNCTNINNHVFIKRILLQLPKETLLISPDGGALKKIYKLAEKLQKYKVVECGKTRDVVTGKLKDFKVYEDDLQGKPCLIVDDICDGGGTFIGLSKALKAKNAGKLYLAVSHGIFSKGVDELNEHYEKIFTTNAFKNVEGDIEVYELEF